MIEYIRGNEDDEALQALGIVVVRILVGDDKSLKQLFLAHGGMNLIMALYQYKQGIAKEQAALTMLTFRKGQWISLLLSCVTTHDVIEKVQLFFNCLGIQIALQSLFANV